MKIYPAMKARMGDWNFFMVRMRMKEVKNEVNFAHDIHHDGTLSKAIQRVLDARRLKTGLAQFLDRADRFFSSIVVAAIGGSPKWCPVRIDSSVVPELLQNSPALDDVFGILTFDGDEKYYALDGQHRVLAIKSRLNENPHDAVGNDFLSVLVVMPQDDAASDSHDWQVRYRRLFSSLNRYAKKTDRDTDIIMDEDDLFAILTRRLITEHDFFQATGRQRDSSRIETKGKNIRSGQPHFTSLQTLYGMNITLLSSKKRSTEGWRHHPGRERNIKTIIQQRPSEEALDEYYDELSRYWDAIVAAFPVMHEEPRLMRSSTGTGKAHALFFPVVQELFARLVRSEWDELADASSADSATLEVALRRLQQVRWSLREPPWRQTILTGPHADKKNAWTVRSEARKDAIEVSHDAVRWLVGRKSGPQFEEALRQRWRDLLYPRPKRPEIDKMWNELQARRRRILSS